MSKMAWPFSTAAGRWAGFGPYYAMFPVDCAKWVVENMCPPGGAVLDPFCGRGTAPFVAQVTGRRALGMDVNPVAWVFADVKTHPEPDVKKVLHRLDDVRRASSRQNSKPENEFQKWAWHRDVLRFLKAARRVLDWEGHRVDRTLMGFILVHIHAKMGDGLSNQMHKSRALGPDYAVRWWKSRGMRPPAVNPVAYLRDRINWRYQCGVVKDCKPEIVLEKAETALARRRSRQFDLVLTSPPYFNVTDYRQDSWIRLWMLRRGPALPDWASDLKFSKSEDYRAMLVRVFSNAAKLTKFGGAVWVRTSARKFTMAATAAAIRAAWPHRNLYKKNDKPRLPTQTSHFGHISSKPGEVDFLIVRRGACAPPGFALLPRKAG